MLRLLRLTLAVMVFSSAASAQCPAGFSSAQINWDALEFLRTGGSFSGYVTNAQAATQYIAFATQKVTVTHNFTGGNNLGVSTAHTAETNATGKGSDLRFLGNGAITFTFESPVQNVRFSLFDIDVNQRVEVSALAAVSMTRVTTTTLTLTNNNTTVARVDANATATALTSENGTVNVSIAGPVSSFTITTTNTGVVTSGNAAGREDGSIFISDINACTNAAAFPTNYYGTSKPWNNQPGYVLSVVNNKILQTDPATGKSKLIFADPTGNNINSMAYDPYNYVIYYCYSLTGSPATNKSVKKYDITTGTLSTFISDITTLGVPVYESGVESGAAGFYNGSLYLGVEGYASGGSGSLGRKSIVWRIDISGGTPATAVQAYAAVADDGVTANILHDWSDIGLNNGVLYDFDGAAGDPDIYQYDMYSGSLTRITPSSNWVPRQICVDWAGTIYNLDGTIAPYTGGANITTASQKTITSTTTTIPSGGSWGDAAEAFKPKGDLGDAPSSYDPVANAPAVHEINTNLRLGATITSEWSKNTSLFAAGDNDDGMPTPSIVINNSNYLTDVNVFNNTGAPATVCAWVDFNNNGIFDASEGISVNVPSSASTQTVQLFWPNPTTTLAPYSYTFIRIRVTSAANGMTTANPTGWFDDGEVEDYRVQVNAYALPSMLVDFDARKHDVRKGLVTWKISDEVAGTRYLLQHSRDGRRWSDLQQSAATGTATTRTYSFLHSQPADGSNYYRLQVLRPGAAPQWSGIRELRFNDDNNFLLAPNPARGSVNLQVTGIEGPALCRVYAASGALVLERRIQLVAAGSTHNIPLPESLPEATYIVELRTESVRQVRTLVLRR
ncbi:T9SS type A sorting domain-containing protein [Flaviaesturariibacter flavus]|uniref:T9SS type A sorting domain-containing protein n=1 Tax=Flaviaesturariibacter flavus TaxID=2502780 RepID=A0A4R1BMW7_9BACT|nr:GEVED domain-containing protein [Flaviaesturariibacter flavus]TCJ18823.1 T9SS type A sorting domain-containing protein [Flaviaesturariibacter flavus]